MAALKINEAENLLFERMDSSDIKVLSIELDFYSRLNELSDEKLEEGAFSREEIKEGLGDLLEVFGINMSQMLFDNQQ
ncbi:MAG: hypothetical protein GX375_01070 [Clostridiales bacterium]|nr:hypothetical protein [Clostridiales bacterium]